MTKKRQRTTAKKYTANQRGAVQRKKLVVIGLSVLLVANGSIVYSALANNRSIVSPVYSNQKRFKAVTSTSEDNGCRIVAHRGDVRGKADENTLLSMKQAIAISTVSAIEYDIRQISDGTWRVIHDPTFNRTTNKKGEVAKASVKKANKALTKHGNHVPRLKQALGLIGPSGKGVQNELKTELNAKQLTGVLNMLRNNGLADRMVITSSHRSNLAQLNTIAPEVLTGWIMSNAKGQPTDAELLAATQDGVDFINISRQTIESDPGVVSKLHAAGFAVGTRSVDTVSQLYTVMDVHDGRIGENAVDSIVSDNSAVVGAACQTLLPVIHEEPPTVPSKSEATRQSQSKK